LNFEQQKTDIISYIQHVTRIATFFCYAASLSGNAEIRITAGFRFVANQKINGERLT